MHFHRLKRREFIALLGGAAAAWPLAARAEQRERMRRIGVLLNAAAAEQEFQTYLASFTQGLRQLGWVEGQNLRFDVRWNAGDAGLSRTYAAELLGLMPDVILAGSTINLTVIRQATSTVPVVFVQVADPVAQGFVASMRRPGGNVTGFSLYEFSLGGKWVDLLKQLAPRLTRVAFMFSPDAAPYSRFFTPVIEAAAKSLGVELTTAPVRAAADIEAALALFARQPNGGLVLQGDSFTRLHQSLIAELAVRCRLPSITPDRDFAKQGGLMDYGPFAGVDDQYRRAAIYVDRILKGSKPGDLPVQAPIKYQLVINMRTAKALGLDVPLQLEQLADEVID
jgi:putative tryptophan/tyrosine transport system substrate-binding protein